jgi:hypothetical protein
MEDRERAGCYGDGLCRVEGAYPQADWEAAEDLTALSGPELSGRLEELVREERRVSRRRRALHAEIDVIRAELVRRGAADASAEELALALASTLSRGTGVSP